MENFELKLPTEIYFGKGQIVHLPELVKRSGRRVLLTYGGGSIKKSGLYDQVTTLFKENDIEWVELSGIDPNPRKESVDAGAQLVREHDLDCIVAVGGGSVIDCSKAISVTCKSEYDCWTLVTHPELIGEALPIYTVLTMSATGSEMNWGAVITNLDTNEKLGFRNDVMRPKASICDPTYTYTVPAYQTACGCADIMSHVFESYFDQVKDADIQDGLAESILKACVKYVPIALKEPDNYSARANIMWASTNGLNGLTGVGKVKIWVCHPMEHVLSAHYDITHGAGLAILTPRWMKHILNEKTAPQLKHFACEIFHVNSSLSDIEAAKEGIKKLYDFFVSIGLPMTLEKVGIDDKKLKKMAHQAYKDDFQKTWAPLTEQDIYEIYCDCLVEM